MPVVCARAAIVKSWAHAYIPVPKGANLSNNALFEYRGMQAVAFEVMRYAGLLAFGGAV